MKSKLLKWLCVIGNPPLVYDDATRENVLEQGSKYYELKKEELDEEKDAIQEGSVVEYLDAVLDQLVYLTQQIIQLEHAGVDVNGAFEAILNNNESKFTTSEEYIYQKHSELVQKHQVNNWYVDSNEYDGQIYHCLKHYDTNKVTKFVDHEKVDLEKFVPKHLLKEIYESI